MECLKVRFHFVIWAACLMLIGYAFTPNSQAQRSNSPTPVTKIPEDKKIIRIFARQGPYGELYVPKELVAVSDQFKLAQQVNQKYFFPSLYFLVSAMPQINKTPQRVIGEVQHWDFDEPKSTIEWINLKIKIKAVDCHDRPISDPEQIRAKVRILGVLPDETLARVEEQKPAQLAGALGELTNAFAPLVPGQSELLRGGANTASVLFRNLLFPPKLEAYRYSFIQNPGSLGWYWKTDEAHLTSLMGTRRGILLLQVEKGKDGIKKLQLSYELMAQWQGKGEPSTSVDDEYVDDDEIGDAIDFSAISNCTQEPSKDIFETADYRTLRHLDEFPMLVPQDAVCKIFQIEQKQCPAKIKDLESTYSLAIFEGTRPSSGSATDEQETIRLLRRSDLEKILGLSKPEKGKPESPQ